jgi:hypothetical protein
MEDIEHLTYSELADVPREPMHTVSDPIHSDFVDGNAHLVQKLYKLDDVKRKFPTRQALREHLESLSD